MASIVSVMMNFYTNGLIIMEKITKIHFVYRGENIETDYVDDGYDQINAVLERIAYGVEYIADSYVIPDLIVALRRGGERTTIGKLNLSDYGVSDVRFQLETGKWVDVKEEWLRNV